MLTLEEEGKGEMTQKLGQNSLGRFEKPLENSRANQTLKTIVSLKTCVPGSQIRKKILVPKLTIVNNLISLILRFISV